MPFTKIIRRLTLFQLLIVSIGTAVTLIIIFNAFVGGIRAERDKGIRMFVDHLIGSVREDEVDSQESIQAIVEIAATSEIPSDLPWFTLSDAYRILYASDDRAVAQTVFEEIRERGAESLDSFSNMEINEVHYRFFRTEVHPGLYLTAIYSRTNLDTPFGRVRALVFILFPMIVGIVGLGNWLLVRRILEPIEEIVETMELVTHDGLGTAIVHTVEERESPLNDLASRDDEIARLKRSFDEMLAQLHETAQAEYRFVAETAHDIRDPLTVLQAELQMSRPEKLTVEERERLLRSGRQLDDIQRLSSDLMLMANYGLDTGELRQEKISLNGLLLDLAGDAFAPAATKDIALQPHIPDEEIECVANYVMLRRALTRALDHVLGYTAHGNCVSIGLERSNDVAHITIAEHFAPSSRSSTSITSAERCDDIVPVRSAQGSRGMAITREIVRVHGGTIEFSSSADTGTSITLCIPLGTADLRLP